MEESCSKPAESPQPEPPPQPMSRFEYAGYAPEADVARMIRAVQIRPMALPINEGPLYKRNDPANRAYRMRKRQAAQVYHCLQCNKHIKYPSKISEHIRKHTGEKPHACQICGQSFSQAHSMKSHMRQHMHEKPYKCSFCTAVFHFVDEKNEHEAQHMHPNHSESMEDDCPPFLTVGGAPEDDLDHAEQIFYACPLGCGFQNPVESVVVSHLQIDHEHERHRYVNVSWGPAAEHVEENVKDAHPVNKIRLGSIPDELIVTDYNEEADQVYEYYDHEYVDQEATEVISEPTEGASDQPCSSNSYNAPFVSEESVGQVAQPRNYKIVYEGEEEEQNGIDGLDLVNKKMIIPEEQDIKQVIPSHMYAEFPIDDHDLEAEVEHVGMNEDEEEEEEVHERVRVIVNPNPPKRGTKSLRDHHEASAAMREIVVDAATIEMAAPSRNIRRGYARDMRKKKPKDAQNLDWIIDAVAKGVDVSEASPHHRKKATFHKCEFCGKVDKYPSKIRAHMRTHTGEKPFKCEICGMAFSQRTPMRLHLRRHFDQKPYECDVPGCKERFVSGAILKMHFEKKHLNKKKYVCARGCGRVFSSAFNQRHHEKKCSQNTYLTWVEENESGEDTVVEYQEEDEEYMDEMMDPSTSEPQVVSGHFVEEPVFLHP